jgi:IclR family transcriptional regulator, blcABC operon repressor
MAPTRNEVDPAVAGDEVVPMAAGLVPAVARALTLLERLARQREPMGLARLSAELQLPKSSVHGLCNTLLSFGYLRRQRDGSFLVGPRVLHLAEAFVAGTDVAREFNEMWLEAGKGPDETVVLSVLDGLETVYVAVCNSARPLGLSFKVGMRLPAYLTGTGKAVLAALPPEAVRRLVGRRSLPLLTERGPRSLAELQHELAQIRARGWSLDDQTARAGVASLAAPVHDASGAVVAGVGLCVNTARLGPAESARYREEILNIARVLSRRIGGDVPATAAKARRTG